MTQDIAFFYAKDLRPAFLAHMASRLDALICKQTKEIYRRANVIAPVRSVSVVVHLSRCGAASIADIARVEGQSHQLVSSRVAPLVDLGLVKITPDLDDERSKVMSLTPTGKADAKKIEKLCGEIASTFRNLNKELGADLMTLLEQAEKSLSRTPIAERAALTSPQARKTRRKVAKHA